MKTVSKISVDCPIVECPACNETIDLHGDPRGTEVQCDECQEKFKIAEDAEITL